jgi:hypothetical protein
MKRLLLAALALAVIGLAPAAQAHRQAKTPNVPPPLDCQGKDWQKCFFEEQQRGGGGS